MIATTDEIEKVDMPMGVDINAESAEEIAVSILGKIIETKNSSQKATRRSNGLLTNA